MSEEKRGLKDYLAALPDTPKQEKIDEWKTHYDVFGSAFTEFEIFLFRPMSRAEHDSVQKMAIQAQQEGREFDVELEVVKMCCLWMSAAAEKSLSSKAGTVSTLQEQISMHSNFLPPAIAVQMVEEL